MNQKKKKHKCPAIALWMTTFTDLTTLLLTFFILMFTTAEVDGQKLKLILSSFTGSFGIMKGGLTLVKGPLEQMGYTVEQLPSSEPKDYLSTSKNIADSFFKSVIHRGDLKLTQTREGLAISIPAQVFFSPGSVEITKEGFVILSKIGDFLIDLKVKYNIDKQVILRGFSSQEPIFLEKDKNYGISNIWEYNLRLSSGRAENVMVFFIKKFKNFGIPPYISLSDIDFQQFPERNKSRFIMEAYGEFNPLDSNNIPETRLWNRRVDILIKK